MFRPLIQRARGNVVKTMTSATSSADGVDPHSMRHELQRPALGIEDQRRLGRAVLTGHGELRRSARD
jgi:hypothetical protein